MIDVFIENGRNTLHTQFPLRMDDLAEQLASIGVRQSVAQLTAKGTDTLKIEMEGLEDIGNEIVSRVGAEDNLADVVRACHAVRRACPYGYSEFLDMLHPEENGAFHFYQKYDHMGASSKEGIPGLIEEVVRYSAAMSEYTRVCNEEEEAESQNLDEEGER